MKERLLLLLDSYNAFDNYINSFDAYVMPIGKECLDFAFEITMFLRSNGFKAECEMQGKSMKSFFKSVDRQKVPFAIIVGEEEMKNGKKQYDKSEELLEQVEDESSSEALVDNLKK